MRQRINIILFTLSCTTLIYASSEQLPKIKQFPSHTEDDLSKFSYFPQGFYTFCEKPWKYPLITGPCSPCCTLFVSDPNTQHTLGFHVAANNCLTSMTNIIDTYFPSQANIKRNLLVTLFTHANTKLHTHIIFKEKTHKNRFLTIFNLLNAKYHLVDYHLYFNDTDSTNPP